MPTFPASLRATVANHRDDVESCKTTPSTSGVCDALGLSVDAYGRYDETADSDERMTFVAR